MLSRNTILLFCGCFLLTSQPALGATIQEFLPGLLDSHQPIKAAQEKTRSAEYLVRQHRAGYLPSVDFLSETGYEDIHKENGPDTDYGDKTYNRLRAAQLLWDFGATSGMVDKTENFLQQVTFEETDTRQEVLLEGILACVDFRWFWNKQNGARKDSQDERFWLRVKYQALRWVTGNKMTIIVDK